MRVPLLSALFFALIALPGSLWAQDAKKPARVGTGFQPASLKEDLQHGRLVEITVKGQGKINGTLVRVAGDQLFVRTEPGALPRAIAKKDVEKIEKGTKFALSKDNVKLVGTESDVLEPEIQALEIYNGKKRTVRYSGPALSSGERSMLFNLQTAENELAEVELMADRQNQVMENALAIQAEQKKSQELLNRYQESLNLYLNQRSIAAISGVGAFFGSSNTPLGYVSPYYGFYGTNVPNTSIPPNIIQPGLITTPSIVAPPDSLARARLNLALAQSHAVFERDRLVAMVVAEK
jgi:hypothetical protein